MKTKEIKFYNDTLLGLKDDTDQVWLAINHSCKQLGFDYQRTKSQGEKIREDKVLSQGVGKFRVPTKGGEQEVFVYMKNLFPYGLQKSHLRKRWKKTFPM